MAENASKPGIFEKAKAWLSGRDKSDSIEEWDSQFEGVSVSMLLGSGRRSARSRAALYEKYHFMAGDPIISSALRLHATQALGGHETTGDTVFIEAKPDAKGQAQKIVSELQSDLSALFNREAHQTAFNGAAFGDSYARIYAKEKVGVVDLYTGELVYPALVQPFEQGNQTIGYTVSTGTKFQEKLTIKQMARMKMPRMLYVAQNRAIEKSMRMAIQEDDIDNLPILPSLVGGSFLDAAEEPYDKLLAALSGLVNQRILNSVDESIISANNADMTKEQRENFNKNLKKLLLASKERAKKLVQNGQVSAERFYHILPTFGDKQLVRVDGFQGGGAGSNITVEDIFLHARMLAGALGIDLTMLGFADQLSGGLGDGGFFRVSAQSAERSRIIRSALTKFFDDIIDIHTLHKYGFVFAEGERPYTINFYGSISALETEKQHTRESSMNSALALAGVLQQLKEIGLDEKANEHIFAKVMQMDDDAAKLLAAAVSKASKESKAEGGFGGGDGFGGGPGGEPPMRVPGSDDGDGVPEGGLNNEEDS